MEWLEESSLVTPQVNLIHTDVDFKSGLCILYSRECGTAMILTVSQSLHRNNGHHCFALLAKQATIVDLGG